MKRKAIANKRSFTMFVRRKRLKKHKSMVIAEKRMIRLKKPSVVVPDDISLSTERLKKRLLEEGISDVLVKDCEQIMLLEFSDIQEQIKLLCEEHSNLRDTLRQLEVCFSI
ncbi:putative oxysterol-binding protein [Helianthus annuus]|nr:putative oxysterol-binding protein [Helianthus annuus]KAJ0588919.1 putative oxysterol-binding protein [Helianthus annuus]KAJ0597026.1 putative oxysterol-binding protein [Helianthus annuus]KAJ0757708.1 putative oxysterol-binding protein [Helianthus annuus]KAJ0761390.1 putative oxysterol-binding protein [Helianthus annuus]